MSKTRTEMARDLAVLAEEIAAKLDVQNDPETCAFAARVLRALGKDIVMLSESADGLEENYKLAMKLAEEASKIADRSLTQAQTFADAAVGRTKN